MLTLKPRRVGFFGWVFNKLVEYFKRDFRGFCVYYFLFWVAGLCFTVVLSVAWFAPVSLVLVVDFFVWGLVGWVWLVVLKLWSLYKEEEGGEVEEKREVKGVPDGGQVSFKLR